MTQGKYDDIIGLPHHTSDRHPRMSMHQRAAQFAPFAALSGYGAAVNETARLTDQAVTPDEDTLILLDERLHILKAHLDDAPVVTVTRFIPDERKEGGRYEDVTGTVRKIDEYERVLFMENGTRIPLGNVVMLEGDLFP